MPFAAALSTSPNTNRALDEVCAAIPDQVGSATDLVVVFLSLHHAEQADEILRTIRQRLRPGCVLGCTGEAIVGDDREIENGPALSVWAARWAQAVHMEPFHLVFKQTADGMTLLGWPDGMLEADPNQAAIFLLGDPFTFPADRFLHEVNHNHKGLRVVGGMASGVRSPGEARLLLGDKVHREGAAGVLLQGPLGLRCIVSQGCRPIGRHMVITKGQDNVIVELGGKPCLAQLQELWQELSTHEQQLLQEGLHVGLVINEYQSEFHRGDFLVRNVIGMDRDSGALAITDRIRVGQTIQFHVRDAETADEDLRDLLQSDVKAHEKRPGGALIFSCNGRGTRMFPNPDHDARAIRREAGDVPLAGFFAMGELGPVGGQNFMHGFTASVALFEE